MNLIDAVKQIRKELIIKDQPLKAYQLLKKLNLPELKKELEDTEKMVSHYLDYSVYRKYYQEDLIEPIEDEEVVLNAGKRFKRFQWVIDHLALQKAKTVVDMGCADGILVCTLAKLGYQATGVNLHTKSIEVANKRKTRYGLENATFINGDIFDIKDKYDAVICQEVIEHVPDDAKLIEHLSSLGEWVYITTPLGAVNDGADNDRWEATDIRGHLRIYTETSLKSLLKDYHIAEFKVDEDWGVKYLLVKYRKKMKPFEKKCTNPTCNNKVLTYDPDKSYPCSERCKREILYSKRFINRK